MAGGIIASETLLPRVLMLPVLKASRPVRPDVALQQPRRCGDMLVEGLLSRRSLHYAVWA